MSLSDERIADIRARVAAATDGKWVADPTGTVCAEADLVDDMLPAVGPMEVAECYRSEHLDERAKNAEFIAAARQDIPDLLAALEETRTELDRARAGARRRAEELDRLRNGDTCVVGQPWSCGDAHTAGHCVRQVSQQERDALADAHVCRTKLRESDLRWSRQVSRADELEGNLARVGRERDAALAEVERLRAEVERLDALPVCAGCGAVIQPGERRQAIELGGRICSGCIVDLDAREVAP